MFESHHPGAEIKIIDYGLSQKFLPDGPNLHDSSGTIYSIAPEVLLRNYTSQADLWSIGVIAFMTLTSVMPFHGPTQRDVLENILSCRYSFSSPRWIGTSKESRDFISALLVLDPGARPTAEHALHHPWLKSDFSKHEKVADEISMDQIKESLLRYSKYSKLKKLALMVVAHKSTSAEIGGLRDAFQKFDLSQNGTVCLEEFKEMMSNSGMSDEEIESLFRSIDLDGSKLIHFTEFLAATLEARGVIVEQRLAEAFDRIDSDDSGYITKDNLKEFMQNGFLGRELSDEYLAEIIEECDLTRDGMVAYDEFLELWDHADDLDTNAKPAERRRSAQF